MTDSNSASQNDAAKLLTAIQGGKPQYDLTDTGNAIRLADMMKDQVRYVSERKKFIIFDGKRWVIDQSEQVLLKAKIVNDTIHEESKKQTEYEKRRALTAFWAKSSNEPRIRAMVNLAKPYLAISQSELDKDPCLLNCTNGTLDLRTGELRPHRPEDFITKLVSVPYDPQASCPVWDSFLERILPPDSRSYVQRCAGYSATGSQREKLLVVLHGDGDNGKTTFVNAVQGTLGRDYTQASSNEILIGQSKDARAPNPDIARLQGTRFAFVTETDDTARLNEARVKRLTGNDSITARYLHENTIEFVPTHTIWLSTNYKPEIRGQDHAIWRRVRLVPFNETIPESEQDKQLSEKLKQEAPGILAWIVRGCLEYRQNGLQEPEQIQEATAEYRKEMDSVEPFIESCCTKDAEASSQFNALYSAYCSFCLENNFDPLSSKLFGPTLQQKGFTKHRTAKVLLYLGLKLTPKASFA
jgi:putative DNA primase/helicase